MKLLIVSTYDSGGAAKACLRLHEGLLQENINTKVLLKQKHKHYPNTFKFEQTKKNKNLFSRLFDKVAHKLIKLIFLKKSTPLKEKLFIENRDKGLEMFSFPNSQIDITTSQLYQDADIINLHWVANFLDFESFFKNNTKPVVWTLHDMNPFTGGEHYAESMLGMDKAGFPILRKPIALEIEISRTNIELKKNVLRKVNNLHLVTLCDWMTNKVQTSDVFGGWPIHKIPNGINSGVFKPRDRQVSRTFFNIPNNKKVVLFVADSISNHRKGYVYLKKALDKMQRDDVVLCAVGNKRSALETFGNIIELGVINDERLMSMAYSAADVFVIPSLMDNLPNTVLESLMCGTPVIGFPIGGIPDMIKEGENGLLAKTISSSSLFETMEKFFATIDSFNRASIRENAMNKYELKVQADSYIELFKTILNK